MNSARKPNRRPLLIVLAASGWLLAAISWMCYLGCLQEARFSAYTSIGRSDREVQVYAGKPDYVISDAQQFSSAPLDKYLHSTRAIAGRVLIYLRFGHMIALYLDKDGYVESVYWGAPIEVDRSE